MDNFQYFELQYLGYTQSGGLPGTFRCEIGQCEGFYPGREVVREKVDHEIEKFVSVVRFVELK
jgi:hypothetical protein